MKQGHTYLLQTDFIVLQEKAVMRYCGWRGVILLMVSQLTCDLHQSKLKKAIEKVHLDPYYRLDGYCCVHPRASIAGERDEYFVTGRIFPQANLVKALSRTKFQFQKRCTALTLQHDLMAREYTVIKYLWVEKRMILLLSQSRRIIYLNDTWQKAMELGHIIRKRLASKNWCKSIMKDLLSGVEASSQRE